MKKQIIVGMIISIVLFNVFPVWASGTKLDEAIKHSNEYIAEKVNQEDKVKLHTFEIQDKSIDATDNGVVVRIKVHVNHDEWYGSYSGSLNTLHFSVFLNGDEGNIYANMIEETENFIHDENGNYKGTIDRVYLVEHYIEGYELFDNEYTLAMSWHTQFNDWRYFEQLMPVTISYSGGAPEENEKTNDVENVDKSINDEFQAKEDDDERTTNFLGLTAGIIAGAAGIIAGAAGAALVFGRLRKVRQLRYQNKQRKKAKEGSKKVKETRLKKEADGLVKKAMEEKKRGNFFQRLPANVLNSVKRLGRGAANTVTKLMDIKIASIDGNKVSLINAVSFVDPTGATKVFKLLKRLNKLEKLDFKTIKTESLKELKSIVIKTLTPGGKVKEILNRISNIQREYTQAKAIYNDVQVGNVIETAEKLTNGSYRQMSKETHTVLKDVNKFSKKAADKVSYTVDVNIIVR